MKLSLLIRRVIPIVTLASAAILSRDVGAAQPIQFHYQAKLTNAAGTPLQGSHDLYFSVWEGGTTADANSGMLLYSETATFVVSGGVVNHTVGTGTQTSAGPLTETMFQSSSALHLQVGVDTVLNIVLPRTRLESVPFAIHAQSAEIAGNGLPSGFVTLGSSPEPPVGFSDLGMVVHSVWINRGPLPHGVSGAGVEGYNGKLYVVAGLNDMGSTSAQNAYDPLTNEWTPRASVSTPRGHLTYTQLGGLLYAVGGVISGPVVYPNNDRYDPALNTWTSRQALTNARQGHVAAAVNGRLYVSGGVNTMAVIGSTEEYDIGTNSWTPKADMPTPRYLPGFAAINGKVYVAGGQGNNIAEVLTANEAYDVASDTWSPRASMPVARYGCSAAAVGGKMVLAGGFDFDHNQRNETFVYDPTNDSWMPGPPLTQARVYPTCATLNGVIYAVGGSATTINESLNGGFFHLFAKN